MRVEMLETGAAQLRKAAAFDKDALARSEARAADLQRELSSAREVRAAVNLFFIDVKRARFSALYLRHGYLLGD